jgi:hypothetical protein
LRRRHFGLLLDGLTAGDALPPAVGELGRRIAARSFGWGEAAARATPGP